jgi:TPR repeat protein
MGKTYDPVALDGLGIKGFRADPVKAMEWYMKAREAGYETAEHLRALREWMAGAPDFKRD